MSYTTYPGLALVRKTLTIENRIGADLAIEDVDVESFQLGILRRPTEVRVMRRFGRYREEGEAYFGDWNPCGDIPRKGFRYVEITASCGPIFRYVEKIFVFEDCISVWFVV